MQKRKNKLIFIKIKNGELSFYVKDRITKRITKLCYRNILYKMNSNNFNLRTYILNIKNTILKNYYSCYIEGYKDGISDLERNNVDYKIIMENQK